MLRRFRSAMPAEGPSWMTLPGSDRSIHPAKVVPLLHRMKYSRPFEGLSFVAQSNVGSE